MYASHRSKSTTPPTNLDLKDERHDISQDIQAMDKYFDKLKEEVKAFEKQVENNKEYQEKMMNFEKELANVRDHLSDAEISLAQKRDELKKLSESFLELELIKEASVKEHNQIKENIDNAHKEHQLLLEKLEVEKRERLEEHNFFLTSLLTKKKAAQDSLDEVQDRIITANEELTAKNKQIGFVDERYANLAKDHHVLEETHKQKQIELESLKKEAEELSGNVQKNKDDILAFKKENEEPIKAKLLELQAREGELNVNQQRLENKRLEIIDAKNQLEIFYNKKFPNFHV